MQDPIKVNSIHTGSPIPGRCVYITAAIVGVLFWVLVVFTALSNCALHDISRFSCPGFFNVENFGPQILKESAVNKLKLDPKKSTEEIENKREKAESSFRDKAATKGQFGDLFGALNSLVAIFTAVGVFWTIKVQRTNHHEQIKKLEKQILATEIKGETNRYLTDTRISTETYNSILNSLTVPDGNGKNWTARQALFHLWTHRLIYKIPRYSNQKFPLTGLLLKPIVSEIQGKSISSSQTVQSFQAQIQALTNQDKLLLIQSVESAWMSLFAIHGYDLGALLRTHHQVAGALLQSHTDKVTEDTRKTATDRWVSQLSNIELKFLLCHLAFNTGNDSAPAIQKAQLTSAFRNLEPGFDPVISIVKMVLLGHVQGANGNRINQSAFG